MNKMHPGELVQLLTAIRTWQENLSLHQELAGEINRKLAPLLDSYTQQLKFYRSEEGIRSAIEAENSRNKSAKPEL